MFSWRGVQHVSCLRSLHSSSYEHGLVTSIYIFLEIWMYGNKFPILAQRVQGFCHWPYYYFIKFFLLMILLHHIVELRPPRVWSARSLLCICDQHSPNFRSLVLAALKSLVVYYHLHLNVFLGCSVLNPFRDFPICLYECHIILWSAHGQIKPVALDLWGTFTVEGKDLLSKMLEELMAVYQIILPS